MTTNNENSIVDTTTRDTKCREAHHPSIHEFELKQLRNVRINLLAWYDVHRRRLPWRGDPYIAAAHQNKSKSSKELSLLSFINNAEPESEFGLCDVKKNIPGEFTCNSSPRKVSPYETWVSEIMLQQTRVETVVDYFLRWMDVFPTVETLANASVDAVNAQWAGLGYYRRARMLHEGAKFVMENHKGMLPSSIEELRKIPGIGPYTAGAIASIAFGIREPLVDGNVIRVAARLRAIGADPKNKRLIQFSWKLGRELVEECDRPGELNQALMELGATICTVQNPQCAQCPVRTSCLAYEEQNTYEKKPTISGESSESCELCDFSRVEEWRGDKNQYQVTRYPLKAKKIDSKLETICVSVISHGDGDEKFDTYTRWKFLMTKRPESGLLAGQWEFIQSTIGGNSDKVPPFSQRKTHMKSTLLNLFGGNSSTIAASNKALRRRDLGELVHIFSHVKHYMGVDHLHFDTQPSVKETDTLKWMTIADMESCGITTGVKKILHLVHKGHTSMNSTKRKRNVAAAKTTKQLKSIASFFVK